MKRSGFLGLAVLGVAALPLRSAAQSAGSLRVRVGSDVSNLDPLRIFGIENQTVSGNIYNGLTKFDQKTNKIVSDVARSWEVSPDGKIYTFHLYPNVKWHKNYGVLTADDVKFSIERIIDPASKSSYAAQYADVDKVIAINPSTVRVVLKQPSGGFPEKVAAFNQGWIVCRKAVTEMGDKYQLNPIGTGPFVFESWSPGSRVNLSAHPGYFGGRAAIQNLSFVIIKEEAAAAVALENGEIDIFYALQSPEVISRLRAVKRVTVLSRESNFTVNLVLNTTRQPLSDRRVRQALTYGINRDALVKDFFKGNADPAYSVLTSSFPEYTTDVPHYPYDPDKAKSLLSDTGAAGFDLELVSVALHPYDQIVVPIASDLGKIGVKAKITVLERGAYGSARAKGDVQTVFTGVTGPPDPDSPLDSLYSSKSFPPGLNTARYHDVDNLLEEASASIDPKKRLSYYREVVRKTMTDVPVIPLYVNRLFLAYNSNVSGVVQNSLFTYNALGAKVT